MTVTPEAIAAFRDAVAGVWMAPYMARSHNYVTPFTTQEKRDAELAALVAADAECERMNDDVVRRGLEAAAPHITDDDYLHASLIIACLVRRLGGHVTIDPAELANEPAAMATVGTAGGFDIKVIEPDPPGDNLAAALKRSLVDAGLGGRTSPPSLLDVGYVERSPTMLGGSLNPSPDCDGPRKPPGATELWWCDSHTQFHKPRGATDV